MKKICIIGAYEHPNFGDQYLFDIIYQWLREYNPGIKIFVPWADTKNIKWQKDVSVGGGWKDLLKCDAIIYGGGGYMGEPGKPLPSDTYLSRLERNFFFRNLPSFFGGEYFRSKRHLRHKTINFLKYLIISQTAKFFHKPYLILSVGFGPVTTAIGRFCLRKVLSGAACINLRDLESQKYAEDICPGEEINQTADMVLSQCRELRKSGEKFTKIAIHLGTRIDRFADISLLADKIKELHNSGYSIKFIIDSKPGTDNTEIPNTINKILGLNLEIVPYTSVQELITVIESVEVLLTTKLHAGIAAYALGVFPVSVAMHIKTARFYRQVGLEEYSFNLSKEGIEQGFRKIYDISNNPSSAFSLLNERRNEIKGKALKNKEALKNFLDNCSAE